ncbi:MAG: metal ABC transporter substrate-binding protein [Defluviitaleaceae bacterium]|nr:metal ABC transporter substrate-binding protein [Defluviitaleaceae bacterium]
MFKRLVMLLAIMLVSLLLVGCDAAPRDSDENTANIVATVFPLYDWTRVILGSNPGNLTATYLLESGVDLHNYTPSVRDVALISTSDLFLWVGGKSDTWVLNAMANPQNQYRRNVPVMRMLSIHETQIFPIDGVIPGDVGGEDCCGGTTHDEHVWLSLPFAKRFVERIRDEIIILDPENEEYYNTNAAAYITALDDLHRQFSQMVELAARQTILVVDRFPFLYMTIDYNLEFLSAFDGCFAATEISMQRQAELANAVNNLNLDAIMIIDNHPVANAVSYAAGRELQVIELQDFQSISRYHIQQGMTFLQGMQQNLEALSAALN